MYKGLNALGLCADNTACGHYRIMIPFDYLNKHGANCKYLQACSMQDIMSADIIIVQRQYDMFVAENMLFEAMRYGKMVVYEVDDNLHSVLPSSPVYPIYHQGTKELKAVGDIINRVHGITVSTDELAGDYYSFNGNMEILPNSIDFNIRDWVTRPDDKDSDSIVLGWSGGTCFDSATEILTENGFKLFTELERGEKVATLNKFGELEYQEPTEYVNTSYTGIMDTLDNRELNYCVTPNHWMLVARSKKRTRKNLKYELVQSYHLKDACWRFKKDALWRGETAEEFVVPAYGGSPEKSIPMDLWLKFLGYWLPNGTVKDGRVRLKRYNIGAREYEEILEKLSDLGYEVDRGKNDFHIKDEGLSAYLLEFGDIFNRRIPKNVLGLSSDLLRIVLDYCVAGGNNIIEYKGDSIAKTRVFIPSKELSDGLVEIALKIGWVANVTTKPKKGMMIDGELFDMEYVAYRVSFGRGLFRGKGLNPYINGKDIKTVEYSGSIHCVTVPNHLIFVRRNGRCMWAGNTHLEDIQLAKDIVPRILNDYPKVKFGLYTSEQLAYIVINKWGLDPERVLYIPPRPFKDYPGGLAYFDIGLAPVVNCRFNAAKCLDVSTPVIGPSGEIPIGDVVVGDFLFGVNDFVKVQAVERQPLTDGLQVTTDSGRRISMTPNHRLLTTGGWRQARRLKIGDNLIVMSPPLPEGERDPGLKRCIDPITDISPITLESVDIQVEGGIFMANGFVSHNSNLKVLEYGAWGIPSVTSKVPPYSRTIKNGYNGYSGLTYENVATLVENESLRREIGSNMREIVHSDYDMETNCHLWPQAWLRIRNRVLKGESAPVVKPLWGKVGRNDPCPCGSGRKYKSCECYPSWGA